MLTPTTSHACAFLPFAGLCLVLLACDSGADGDRSGTSPTGGGTGGVESTDAGSGGGREGGRAGSAGMTGGAGSAGNAGTSGTGGTGGMTGSAGVGAHTSDAGAKDAASSDSSDASPPMTGTPSEGCGNEPAPSGSMDIDVDGTSHRYIVSLPSGYDEGTAYPLLMAFHGAGLDAESFQRFFDLRPIAGEEAIIVYFEAIGGQWSYNRDLAYLDATVARLESQYCIDEERVFATGHSAGGYFSNAVGARRAELVRAIAPISGGSQFRDAPSQDVDVAVWIAHGDTDTIVPTSAGRMARDFWVTQNGCDAEVTMPVEPSPCVSYAGCSDGNPVHYCEYEGGHNIPSFATQAVWDFFQSS